jgi:hypothetical protein
VRQHPSLFHKDLAPCAVDFEQCLRSKKGHRLKGLMRPSRNVRRIDDDKFTSGIQLEDTSFISLRNAESFLETLKQFENSLKEWELLPGKL